MGTVAVFQMHCCGRLFIRGRYSGKLHSTSGYYPQAYCTICKIQPPPPGSYQSNCSFVSYWFEDRLEFPFLGGVQDGRITRRYLSTIECKNFCNKMPKSFSFKIAPSGVNYESDLEQ